MNSVSYHYKSVLVNITWWFPLDFQIQCGFVYFNCGFDSHLWLSEIESALLCSDADVITHLFRKKFQEEVMLKMSAILSLGVIVPCNTRRAN